MIQKTQGGVLLHLFVQPKASKNEIIGPHNNELKIKITSPPVDGQANEAVIRFIAKTLSISKNEVQLIRGESSRHKVLKILGISIETVANSLQFDVKD